MHTLGQMPEGASSQRQCFVQKNARITWLESSQEEKAP